MKTLFHPVRLIKSAATGIVASLVDMGVLLVLVEWFGVSPPLANLPAILIGSLLQFFGNRRLVFENREAAGVYRQMVWFAVVEALSFALNGLLFFALVHWTPLHYTVDKIVGSLLVYFGFSYPLWGKIFVSRTTSLTSGAKL